MRMFHYLLGASLVAGPLLLGAAVLGIFGYPEWHLRVALVAAILCIGLHSLFIMFMIVTGRILKEAVASRDLSQSFLDELNEFFARKSAYPAAVFAAMGIVGAGVLGYGALGLGLPPALHWLAGLAALTFNLWALPVELRTLKDNQGLVDRAAAELDSLDAAIVAGGGELPQDEEISAERIAYWAGIVSFSIWMPYFYWVMVVWRGDFSKASVHPWLEISGLALLVWFLARREIAARGPTAEHGGAPEQ